jgi:hypothetical protein
MRCQGQFSQRMIVVCQADGLGVADIVYDLDGFLGFAQAEAAAVQYVFVGFGVQFGEAAAELELLSFDLEGAVGAGAGRFDVLGDDVVIDAQEPADAGALQFEVAGGAVVLMEVYDILFEVAEDPEQHVEEVHADVGGDAAGLF